MYAFIVAETANYGVARLRRVLGVLRSTCQRMDRPVGLKRDLPLRPVESGQYTSCHFRSVAANLDV